MSEDREIAAAVPLNITVSDDGAGSVDRLITMAVEGNADIEKLEKLIDLKNREEARMAREEYDRCFADMQSEFRPVARSKTGDKSKYAPLDSLQRGYGPIIAKHGFSYRWSEDTLDEGRLRVSLTISGHGHSQSNHKDLPAYEPDTGATSGKPIMNILQAEGTRSTYGHRYTFIAGFGLIIEDEDTDGVMKFDDGVKYGDYILRIDEETNLESLRELVKEYRKRLRDAGDERGVGVITKYYTNRKAELS